MPVVCSVGHHVKASEEALAVHQDGLGQGPERVQTALGPAGPRLKPRRVGKTDKRQQKQKRGETALRPVEFDIWTWPHRSYLAVTVYGVHHETRAATGGRSRVLENEQLRFPSPYVEMQCVTLLHRIIQKKN